MHGELIELVRARTPDAVGALEDPVWTSLSPAGYSFRILDVRRFDADLMQEILEMTTPTERLEMLRTLLGNAQP